jgi:hypothetical protein
MVRGLTASLAQEGFEPLVATVDGVEMKLAAAAFAGFVIERLMGEAQSSGKGREERGAVGDQERIALDGAFEVGPDGGGGGVR